MTVLKMWPRDAPAVNKQVPHHQRHHFIHGNGLHNHGVGYFAGPFMGHMFLVMVDSHSKWLDVQIMQSITAEKTIEKLQSIFSTHGLPKQIITDNGTSFTSEKFKQFFHQEWHQNLIHILCSIPSLHKWTGREGSPSIHTRAQRNVTRHSDRKTDQIPF